MPEFPALAPPPDPAGRLRELAAEISAEVEFMSANFGPPALKKITVSPIPGAFGQGFPGLLYLSTLSYLNPHERPAHLRESQSEQMFYSDLLHAHEVAHQWWGNVVASAGPPDDWIMEALASYSALMFLEKKKGRKALDTEMAGYRVHLLKKEADGQTIESAGPIIWGTRLSSSQAPGAWRAITYEKGAWIIHMLRGRLGDDAFLKMLASMTSRYRYKTIATDQFRELAAEFLPAKSPDPKLEDFFAQWVYGTGIPTIKMSVASSGKAPAIKVRGTVEQSDVDDDFSTLVPVEAQLAGRRSIVKWVQTSSEPVQFSMDLKVPAVKILLDPSGSLLAVKK
jgi:aminopeptidase N